MTTYRCNICKEYWTQGPTRDLKYNHKCFKCLEKQIKQMQEPLKKETTNAENTV